MNVKSALLVLVLALCGQSAVTLAQSAAGSTLQAATPVHVAGAWQWRLPVNNAPLALAVVVVQTLQKIEITAKAGANAAAVSGVSLRGDAIRFTLTYEQFGQPVTLGFSGRVNGEEMGGTVQVSVGEDGTLDWTAVRTERGTIRAE
jgi:hypothetical protein